MKDFIRSHHRMNFCKDVVPFPLGNAQRSILLVPPVEFDLEHPQQLLQTIFANFGTYIFVAPYKAIYFSWYIQDIHLVVTTLAILSRRQVTSGTIPLAGQESNNSKALVPNNKMLKVDSEKKESTKPSNNSIYIYTCI